MHPASGFRIIPLMPGEEKEPQIKPTGKTIIHGVSLEFPDDASAREFLAKAGEIADALGGGSIIDIIGVNSDGTSRGTIGTLSRIGGQWVMIPNAPGVDPSRPERPS